MLDSSYIKINFKFVCVNNNVGYYAEFLYNEVQNCIISLAVETYYALIKYVD